jgi:hypothetical protein
MYLYYDNTIPEFNDQMLENIYFSIHSTTGLAWEIFILQANTCG